MKQFTEIIQDLSEALGRPLTEDELDYAYILKLTGAYGFFDFTINGDNLQNGIHQIQTENTHSHPERDHDNGDKRYLARPGNTIDWQAINEKNCNMYTGIILCPEKSGERLCAAQFTRRGIKRIWITIEQAENCIRQMAAGISLLNAVENVIHDRKILEGIN